MNSFLDLLRKVQVSSRIRFLFFFFSNYPSKVFVDCVFILILFREQFPLVLLGRHTSDTCRDKNLTQLCQGTRVNIITRLSIKLTVRI